MEILVPISRNQFRVNACQSQNLYKTIKSGFLFQCMPHYPQTRGSRKAEMSQKIPPKLNRHFSCKISADVAKIFHDEKKSDSSISCNGQEKPLQCVFPLFRFSLRIVVKRMVLNEVMFSRGYFPGTSRIGELPQWQVTHYLRVTWYTDNDTGQQWLRLVAWSHQAIT